MDIYPAIDLKNGRCVRLYQGDFATAHQVAEDPFAQAEAFYKTGAGFLHMVDLDGARRGTEGNYGIISETAERFKGRLSVQTGGGLRTMDDLGRVLESGVFRAVIGSAATNGNFVKTAADTYGDRLAAGIDALNGRVRISGWTADSGENAREMIKRVEGLGVKTVIYTDISTDGMLTGPPFETFKELRALFGGYLIASGGIASLDDIRRLKSLGIDGVIIGKALYSGAIDLSLALEAAAG